MPHDDLITFSCRPCLCTICGLSANQRSAEAQHAMHCDPAIATACFQTSELLCRLPSCGMQEVTTHDAHFQHSGTAGKAVVRSFCPHLKEFPTGDPVVISFWVIRSPGKVVQLSGSVLHPVP